MAARNGSPMSAPTAASEGGSGLLGSGAAIACLLITTGYWQESSADGKELRETFVGLGDQARRTDNG